MAIRTELHLRLPNTPGALGRICQDLAAERVTLAALSLEAGGLLRFVVDNPVHAAGILRERQYQVGEADVLYVEVPNDPGACASVLQFLTDAGVNLDYCYATALDGQSMAALVIGVPDAQRASADAGL